MAHDTRTPRQDQRLAQIASDKAGLDAHAVARTARSLLVALRSDGVPSDASQLLAELYTVTDQLRGVLIEIHDAAGRDPFLGRRVRGYAFGAATLMNDALTALSYTLRDERESAGAVS